MQILLSSLHRVAAALAILGTLLCVVGVGLVYFPAGVIAAGCSLIVAGYVTAFFAGQGGQSGTS